MGGLARYVREKRQGALMPGNGLSGVAFSLIALSLAGCQVSPLHVDGDRQAPVARPASTQPVVTHVSVKIPECKGPGSIVIPARTVTFDAKVNCSQGWWDGNVVAIKAVPSRSVIDKMPAVTFEPEYVPPPANPPNVDTAFQYKNTYNQFRAIVQCTLFVVYSPCPENKNGFGIAHFEVGARICLFGNDHHDLRMYKLDGPDKWKFVSEKPIFSDSINTWAGQSAYGKFPIVSAVCSKMPEGLDFGQRCPINNSDMEIPIVARDSHPATRR
jgi:hypothetical protein